MLSFLYTYTYWHYTNAVIAMAGIVRNILIFLWRFFSIPDLLKTLVSPWQRLQESYGDGFDIQEKLTALVVNTIMRLVGAVVRLAVISFGVVVLLLASGAAVASFIVWLFLPAVIGLLVAVSLQVFL